MGIRFVWFVYFAAFLPYAPSAFCPLPHQSSSAIKELPMPCLAHACPLKKGNPLIFLHATTIISINAKKTPKRSPDLDK